MELSFLFVFTLLLLLSFFEINDESPSRRKIYYYSACTIIVYSMGFGYQLGVDWVEYERLYVGESSNTGNYEILYIILNNLLSKAGISFWLYVISLKILFFISLFLMLSKYCKLPVLALTLTLLFVFPFLNDPLRQLIAAALLFYSFYFSEKGPCIVNVFIGSMFHSSYIIFISGYLRFFTKRSIFIILIISSLLLLGIAYGGLFVNSGMIYKKLSFYLEYSSTSNVYALLFRIIIFSYICFSTQLYRINSSMLGSKTTNSFWILSLIYLWLEIIAFTFPLLSQRMRLYLTPFSFIMLSNYLYFCINKLKNNIIAAIICSFLIVSLYQFLNGPMGHFYSLENNFFLNYIDGFSNDKTYEVNEFWSKGI